MRGGNGRLSKRQLSLLCLFGCLLDGLLRFLHHSHLLWFVLSPRRQTRRRQVTERTIVVVGSAANGIRVTRERWVAQSIAKRIRISRELSNVFARNDYDLDDKTPAIGSRLREKSEMSGAAESAANSYRILRPDGGEGALPADDARVGREPHVHQVWVWCVDPNAEAVAETAGRDSHAVSPHHLE